VPIETDKPDYAAAAGGVFASRFSIARKYSFAETNFDIHTSANRICSADASQCAEYMTMGTSGFSTFIAARVKDRLDFFRQNQINMILAEQFSSECFTLRIDSTFDALVEKRWLIPTYCLNDSPLAWICSVCAKLFSIPIEEALEATDVSNPPAQVEREFRRHNCKLQLRRYFPDPNVWSAVSGSQEET
jgi:hypothetical protein